MISPWQIYIVMQLDAIGLAAMVGATIGGVVVALMWPYIVGEIGTMRGYIVGFSLTGIWLLVTAVATFLPSSKTAAAMYVIPAIANNEAIQAEAGDIYKLAKQGLAKLVSEEKRPAADEKKTE